MAEITLRVSPEIMMRQVDTISSCIEEIRTHFRNIENHAKNTQYYWEGKVSNLHMKKFNKVIGDWEGVLDELIEQPKKLERMAGIYRAAEEQSVQDANSLSNAVIF